MRKILSVCAVVLSAVTICSPQDSTTGNWLLTACQNSIKSMDDPKIVQTPLELFRDGYCRGFVQGVSVASSHVCQGENVTLGQEVRVVFKYLQDHPEELDKQKDKLVDKALAKAFPCGN